MRQTFTACCGSLQRIDQASDDGHRVSFDWRTRARRISCASLTALNAATPSAAAEGGAAAIKLVADERTNSVLLSGERVSACGSKPLIAHLDTPLETGGDTQVIYLRYADAEKSCAAKLKEQVTGIAAGSRRGTGAQGRRPRPPRRRVSSATHVNLGRSRNERPGHHGAAEDHGAIIVGHRQARHPPRRRCSSRPSSARSAPTRSAAARRQLGRGQPGPSGTAYRSERSSNPADGASIGSIAIAIAAIRTRLATTGIPNGLTARRRQHPRYSALTSRCSCARCAATASTNILQMPSVVTMDNEEAELKVAQEVPFLTGHSRIPAPPRGPGLNPFQTIQREEVGTTLKSRRRSTKASR